MSEQVLTQHLPSGWNVQRLDEVAEIVSGGTPSREVEEFWLGGTIPWATPTDITRTKSRTLSTTGDYITEVGLRNSSASLLPPGTLLMTSRATLGEIKIACVEICTNQGFKSLVPRNCIDGWYLYYQLRLNKPRYEVLGIGSTFLEVNKKDTAAFSIPTAPLHEQRKIASILTTVDRLIEQTEALIEKYRRVKQGMMADLLSRGVDEHGKLRPTQKQAPQLYKQSELGWIPKEWEVETLGHFLSYISYGFTNPMPETKSGPWMVTAANVKGGQIQYKTCRHTTQKAYDTLLTNKCRPKVNDILLTKDGTLGRLAIVDLTGICINQSVAVLRTNENAEPHFIKLLLESPKYQQKMLDDAGGSTIKHIYITIVDKMLIAGPTAAAEQERISELIEQKSMVIAEEETHLAKLRTLKTGLMQDLLTGKVRVKVDQDEEATADV